MRKDNGSIRLVPLLAVLLLAGPRPACAAIFATGEGKSEAAKPAAPSAEGLSITKPGRSPAWDSRFQAAQVELLVNAAKASFDRGEFDAAIDSLKRADAAAPFNSMVHTLLASCHIARGDAVGAVQSARAAVQFDERNLLAREYLAHALLMAGRPEEAVQTYVDMARLDPRNPKSHAGMGAAYYQMNRLADAESSFKKTVELSPNDAYAFEMLGNLATARGAPKEAISYLQKAVELAPQNADALNSLATVLAADGNLAAAEAAYREAVRVQPFFAKGYRNLGAMLEQQGRFVEAIQVLLIALDLQFDSAIAWQHLMRSMIGLLDKDPQVSAAKLEEPADPKMPPAEKAEFHYAKAIASAKENKSTLAARHLLAAITWNDRNPKYFNDFGVLAAMGVNPELALPFFRAALFLDPDYAAGASNLANATQTIELTRRQRAIAELSNAIQKDPKVAENGAAHFQLATLFAEFNLVSNALPHFARSVELAPSNVQFRLDYCQALYIMGREDDALDQCRDLMKRVPDNPGLMNRMGWLLLHKRDADLLHRYLARDILVKANEAVRYMEPNYLRNLAKAYAANGEWPAAIEVGTMAFDRAEELGDRSLREAARVELEDYRAKRAPSDLFRQVKPAAPAAPGTAPAPVPAAPATPTAPAAPTPAAAPPVTGPAAPKAAPAATPR